MKKGRMILLFCGVVWTSMMSVGFAQHPFSLRIHIPGQLDKVIVEIQKSGHGIERGDLSFRGEWAQMVGNLEIEGEIIGFSEEVIIRLQDGQRHDFLSFVIDTGANHVDIVRDVVSGQMNVITNSTSQKANAIHRKLLALNDRFLHLYGDSVETMVPGESGEWVEGPKKLILNNVDRLTELNQERLALLQHEVPTYYTLISYLNAFRRRSTSEQLEHIHTSIRRFPPELQETGLATELNEALLQRIGADRQTQLGKTVPTFSVKDNKGQLFTNTSLAGRPYIIAFSATWCVPCEVYEKKLKALYDRYHPHGLEVVYFNLHNDETIWNEQIRNNDLHWINVSERVEMHESAIAKMFHVSAIPNYILVDRQGKQVYNDRHLDDGEFLRLEKFIIANLAAE